MWSHGRDSNPHAFATEPKSAVSAVSPPWARWSQGRDSNPHVIYLTADFKSAASAISPPWVMWSGREDLNLRRTAPKAVALPGCATPRCGVPGRARTCDIYRVGVALSRLSYRSTWRREGDLNPRYGDKPHDDLANRCLQPLSHPSITVHSISKCVHRCLPLVVQYRLLITLHTQYLCCFLEYSRNVLQYEAQFHELCFTVDYNAELRIRVYALFTLERMS